MANNWVTKRPREEEDSEPGEFELSDSDVILALSDDNDFPAKVKKRVKLEDSNKDTIVRNTAIRKLKSAPKGSIGIAAVRALLAKSGSSSNKFADAAKETNSGLRKTGRKTSNAKGKEKLASTRGVSPPIKSKKTKVAVIIFLHKGVLTLDDLAEEDAIDLDDDEDALQPEYLLRKPPTQLSPDVIQRHKRYGLAVVNGSSGIDIDHEANFWDVEEMLRSLFPALFDWFDGLPTVEANSDNKFGDPKYLPQWLICTKLPGRSSGVSVAAGVAFPTGSDIDFNVQTKRSGFRENVLILTTRTPVPTEVLNKWAKHVGKKPVKSTPCIFPSAANDSDSDFPEYIAALPGSTYLPPAGLAGGRSANAVAGPSTTHPQVEPVKTPEAAIIDIFDTDSSTPSPRQGRTASPTSGAVENLNTSFSGSFYVDESLKALNPWEANAADAEWDF